MPILFVFFVGGLKPFNVVPVEMPFLCFPLKFFFFLVVVAENFLLVLGASRPTL